MVSNKYYRIAIAFFYLFVFSQISYADINCEVAISIKYINHQDTLKISNGYGIISGYTSKKDTIDIITSLKLFKDEMLFYPEFTLFQFQFEDSIYIDIPYQVLEDNHLIRTHPYINSNLVKISLPIPSNQKFGKIIQTEFILSLPEYEKSFFKLHNKIYIFDFHFDQYLLRCAFSHPNKNNTNIQILDESIIGKPIYLIESNSLIGLVTDTQNETNFICEPIENIYKLSRYENNDSELIFNRKKQFLNKIAVYTMTAAPLLFLVIQKQYLHKKNNFTAPPSPPSL